MIPDRVAIYVATEPLDLRRSFDGLAAVVREVLGQDPLSGRYWPSDADTHQPIC
ncbi:IS66 family insertion sequence element accessory protein TnpB [Sorangium sp. So ce406]|uniref:IS66 family insertion sequence element accessory protein TnpB n=1 Tax=Sorangium sp. So ce406 TaxID=3133311 RepID=UPI003F5C5B5A